MIKVLPAPEPPHFDNSVRKKGTRFLALNCITTGSPLPAGVTLKPFWQNCLDDLHKSYRGICAYLCIYLESGVGGVTTDHFIPKSFRPELAYEWSNYRLSCSRVNARKGTCRDIMDPFQIENGWFRLDLVTGTVFPNGSLDTDTVTRISHTIEKLGLNLPYATRRRSGDFDMLLKNKNSRNFFRFIADRSPFVYMEAVRQKLLP